MPNEFGGDPFRESEVQAPFSPRSENSVNKASELPSGLGIRRAGSVRCDRDRRSARAPRPRAVCGRRLELDSAFDEGPVGLVDVLDRERHANMAADQLLRLRVRWVHAFDRELALADPLPRLRSSYQTRHRLYPTVLRTVRAANTRPRQSERSTTGRRLLAGAAASVCTSPAPGVSSDSRSIRRCRSGSGRNYFFHRSRVCRIIRIPLISEDQSRLPLAAASRLGRNRPSTSTESDRKVTESPEWPRAWAYRTTPGGTTITTTR